MNRMATICLVVVSMVLFLVQNTESQTPVPNCGIPGIYACPEKTPGPPVTRDCDYYTCVFYPGLNKWLRRLYNCAPPTGFIKDATTPFNTTLNRCQFNPVCPIIKGCTDAGATTMCDATTKKCKAAMQITDCYYPNFAPVTPDTPDTGCVQDPSRTPAVVNCKCANE